MKHLMTYEAVKSRFKFKVGDYIKFNRKYFYPDIKDIEYFDIVKVLETIKGKKIGSFKRKYKVRYYNGLIQEIAEPKFERLATDEEIEEYEMRSNVKKYNL